MGARGRQPPGAVPSTQRSARVISISSNGSARTVSDPSCAERRIQRPSVRRQNNPGEVEGFVKSRIDGRVSPAS